jgi:hypothetical protein
MWYKHGGRIVLAYEKKSTRYKTLHVDFLLSLDYYLDEKNRLCSTCGIYQHEWRYYEFFPVILLGQNLMGTALS